MSKQTSKFYLTAEYWENPPTIQIILNNHCLYDAEVKKDDFIELKYSTDILCNENNLVIRRYGKTIDDTQIDDNNKIIKDSIIHISKVEINEIDLGNIIYNIPFFPCYPEPWASEQNDLGNHLPDTIKPCTDLCHNGNWHLSWYEPFHIWYLENLWT
jgi:hypothetical protein